MELKTIARVAALAAAVTAWPRPGASSPETDGGGDRGSSENQPEPKKERTWKPFWIDGGVGYEFVNLRTFNADEDRLTAEIIPSSMGGPGVHLGLGGRIFNLTLGARASLANLVTSSGTAGNLQLWSIDGEATLRLLSGKIEPYLLVGGGYSTFGGLGDAVQGVRQGLDIDGANARLGIGVSIQVTGALSLDARATAELLFLARRGIPVRDLAAPQQVGTIDAAKARILQGSGSSIGTAVALQIGPGVRF